MRKDGKIVKGLDPVHRLMPFLMGKRCDAEVYYTEKIDITDVLKYLEKINKGKEKYERTTLFHCLITAMAKTIYNRPLLNRFIAGKRLYDRNDISFSFIAKNKLADNAEERLIILKVNDDMVLSDISNNILNIVSKTRKENTNDINNIIDFVTKGPRLISASIVGGFKLLDFFGLAPKSIMDEDMNFTTCMLSNLGSIGANCCYHHLNNYGTNSIVCTVGIIKDEVIEGKERKIVERIADGVYFTNSVKILKYILENPKLLDEKIATKIDMPKKRTK